MHAGLGSPSPRRLDDELARALGSAVAAAIAPALGGAPGPGDRVVVGRHGTMTVYSAAARGRRVLEIDRGGTPVAALRWAPPGLDAAWARAPDGSWLVVEPHATNEAPWGASDRIRRAARAGDAGAPLTIFESLDYTALDRVPALAEPGRLPAGGGSVILNLLAALAADQGAPHLRYRGPYPTEQLFLALLESFRYEPESPDPLADFMAGGLQWRPDPHERLFTAEGAYVQLRGRVEKVVWRGRTYHRPDWQGVARHAPRRVRDVGDGVRCSLWALGAALEDHLELSAGGDVVRVRSLPPPGAAATPLPAAVGAGVGAAVAATSAPALSGFVRAAAAALALEWGPVDGDLVEAGATRARLSLRLRERLVARLGEAPDAASRAGLALAALGEIALLLGDTLRARAQASVLALPEAEQAAVLAAPAPAAREGDAALITAAVETLLADATRG